MTLTRPGMIGARFLATWQDGGLLNDVHVLELAPRPRVTEPPRDEAPRGSAPPSGHVDGGRARRHVEVRAPPRARLVGPASLMMRAPEAACLRELPPVAAGPPPSES